MDGCRVRAEKNIYIYLCVYIILDIEWNLIYKRERRSVKPKINVHPAMTRLYSGTDAKRDGLIKQELKIAQQEEKGILPT